MVGKYLQFLFYFQMRIMVRALRLLKSHIAANIWIVFNAITIDSTYFDIVCKNVIQRFTLVKCVLAQIFNDK